MKVLFTDQRDGTLFCLVASEVGYDPGIDDLWFKGGETLAVIHGVGSEKARDIVEAFFRQEKLNLINYNAHINDINEG